MKQPDKKTIRGVIRRIDRQNMDEIRRTLNPVSDHLDFIITSFCIILPREDPYTDYPISENNVFGTLLVEDYVFILCDNGVLHVFGYLEKEHWVLYIKPWEMWLKILSSWCLLRCRKCI